MSTDLDQRQRDLDSAYADQMKLRELLWLRHGCVGLYGDDGEMQCSSCGIDFKRASPADIEAASIAAGTRKMMANSMPGSTFRDVRAGVRDVEAAGPATILGMLSGAITKGFREALGNGLPVKCPKCGAPVLIEASPPVKKTRRYEKTAKFDVTDCRRFLCSTAGQHPGKPNAHTVQCAHCKEHDFLLQVNDGDRCYFVMLGVKLGPNGHYMEEIADRFRGGGTSIHRHCWEAYMAEHPEAFEELSGRGPGA